MPPHHRHHPHHPPHHHHHECYEAPESIAAKLDEIGTLLGGSEAARRLSQSAFEDGPPHRQAANSILTAALVRVVEDVARARGVVPRSYDGETVEISWHLPPHLRHRRRRRPADPGASLPTRLLSKLCPKEEDLEDTVDALSEGPEHEVALNVVLLNLLEALHELFPEGADLSGLRTPTVGGEVIPAVHREEGEPEDLEPDVHEPNEPTVASPTENGHGLPSPTEATEVVADDSNSPPAKPKERSVLDWGFRMKFWRIKKDEAVDE